MGNIYLFIGQLLCGLGGGMLVLSILALLCNLACTLWIDASEKFRAICKAESKIFEYQKYRADFMYWYHMQKGESNE